MAPKGRIRLRLTRSSGAAAESTPKNFADLEDEPMADAAADNASEHEEPPAQDDNDDEEAERKGDDSADDDEEAKEEESAKEPSPPPQPVIRRKRLGRPPKNKPPDWDPMVTVTEDTPRRRGRGGWRGRGGRKGGAPPPKAEQVIDAEGTVAEIVDDECVLPDDPEGETKVDKLGNLEGGREYRCRTFTVMGRGDRLYMLSTEPARCVGFRDSYLFFTKHRKLYKIIVDDDDSFRSFLERLIGSIGLMGSIGEIGVMGTMGVTGVMGTIGVTGVIGTIGVTGVIGTIGVIGTTGVMGEIGLIGLMGVTGVIPPIGTTGLMGEGGINLWC